MQKEFCFIDILKFQSTFSRAIQPNTNHYICNYSDEFHFANRHYQFKTDFFFVAYYINNLSTSVNCTIFHMLMVVGNDPHWWHDLWPPSEPLQKCHKSQGVPKKKSAPWRFFSFFSSNISCKFCFKNTHYFVGPISFPSNAFYFIKFGHPITEI